MRVTDGELIAAAHLTTAAMTHGGEAVPKGKSLEYTLKYFSQILEVIGAGRNRDIDEMIEKLRNGH